LGLLFTNLVGCVTKQTQIDSLVELAPLEAPVSHRVVLIGDAGNLNALPVLETVKARLAALSPAEQAKTTVVFLGDNAYPGGLPPKSSPKRQAAEQILDAQASVAGAFAGQVFMVPGNHDTRGGSNSRSIKRQEKYFEKAVTRAVGADERVDAFLPSNGCGGPAEVELSKEGLLVAVNTPWYLADWDRDPSINTDCDIASRGGFDFNYETVIRKNRGRRVIIAGHHPPESYGSHGGRFPVGDYFLPQNLGPVVPLARLVGLVPHDLAHPMYRAYANRAMAAAQKNGSFIFVAGHDHTQQYMEIGEQAVIISGSAAKTGAASLGQHAQFVSGEQGFAELVVHEGGAARTEFFDAAGVQLFQAELPPMSTLVGQTPDPDFLDRDQAPDVHPELGAEQVAATVSKKPVIMGNPVFWGLMGRHHRRVFADELSYPVLDLAAYEGGSTILKAGGGAQTNSLRLLDKYGQQWTLRATTKDATRVLPYPLNRVEFAVGVAEDMFTATHPHAALVVPDLASALDIYHLSPRLVYVPAQPGLGPFSRLVENEVAILERRPEEPESGPLPEAVGGSQKAYSTPQVLERWKENPRRHRIDEAMVVRNRLFDLVLGDFDRHDDQWRWSRVPDESAGPGAKFRYVPIPRDRDQALSNYDGAVPALARLMSPAIRQMKPLGKTIRNPKWHSYNGRTFDETFMPSVDEDVWSAQVAFIQQALTDAVIDKAIAAMPPVVAENDGPAMRAALIQRRDRLDTIAERFYRQVTRVVEVTGSQKKDKVTAEYTDAGLHVRIKRRGKKGHTFERTFDASDTREVRIYGLDGDDTFEVSGTAARGGGIRLRLIGGAGDDAFEDTSRTPGLGKSTHVYDAKPTSKEKRELVTRGRELADHRSNITERHQYYRRDKHYDLDWAYALPSVGYQPEDGALLGVMGQATDHRFKRDPYGARHHFDAAIATTTLGVDLNYRGTYVDVLSRWDLDVSVYGRTRLGTDTWFGLGNEAAIVDDLDFYRVRRGLQGGQLALVRGWSAEKVRLSLGAGVERSRVEENAGRFVTDADSDVDSRVFDPQLFAKTNARLTFDALDNHNLPRRGVEFDLWSEGRLETQQMVPSGTLAAMLASHLPLGRGERWIYGSALHMGTVLGDADFFNAMSAGGTLMRGYFEGQLAGQTTFAHQNDMRVQVLGRPGSSQFVGGLSASVDHGRTWADEASNTWHANFGGGAWFGLAQTLGISVEVFVAPDVEERDPRLQLSMGPLFRRHLMVER